MSIFDAPLNKSTGTSKAAIPEGIYEATCIGIADTGIKTDTYQGKEKKSQQVVLVWAINHVNGFGSQSVVTDWQKLGTHEKSNWMKNFITPSKISISSLKDLLGKNAKLTIIEDDKGYAVVSAYTASKAPFAVPAGLYLPAWLYTKQYPLLKHTAIIDGPRPKTETQVVATPEAVPVAPPVVATSPVDLPF